MRKNNKLFMVLTSGLVSLGIISTNINIGYSYTQESLRKVAYITIDDGPSKHTTKIIDTLDKYNAKATFFMIDNNMKNYPDAVRKIVESGNTAGFHSVSHDIHKLYASDKSAKNEFDVNKKTFYKITGQTSNLVRLPYGSKPYASSASYENLVEASYKVWDWNIDTQDWKSTPSQIVENIKQCSKNKNEVVILIHEREQTVQALEDILKYLTEEGYELLPICQGQEPKNFWVGNLYK